MEQMSTRPGILGHTWSGELRGKKAGFLACGMGFFRLGLRGKDYPECWQTWAQPDDTVVAPTREPRVSVPGYRGATAILAHALGNRGTVGMPAAPPLPPSGGGSGEHLCCPLISAFGKPAAQMCTLILRAKVQGTRVSPSGIRDRLTDSCFMSFQGFALK